MSGLLMRTCARRTKEPRVARATRPREIGTVPVFACLERRSIWTVTVEAGATTWIC